MGDAKRIEVKPISSQDARAIVRRYHYSGKIVQNSQLHLGVFMDGRCGGAMQFGPSTDKRKTLGLVPGTAWNGFLELNRMAFADWLPRNSESRAIGFALRWIAKQYPHVEWILSYADGCQCGDGTIYRASGFLLIGIKKNNEILRMPDGSIMNKKSLNEPAYTGPDGRSGSSTAKRAGATELAGHMLRYIRFLHPAARERLAVPVLPFSEIDRRGASLYKGKPRAESIAADAPIVQIGEGSSSLTSALSIKPRPPAPPRAKPRAPAAKPRRPRARGK